MPRPSAAHVEAARRLLAQDSAADASAEERAAAAGRVYATIFQAFAPIIGAAGFRALFVRSVKLTKAELPDLAEVQLGAEPRGSHGKVAQRLVAWLSKLEREAASATATELYATLIALMTTFIGEQLVWQIMRRAFPAMDETLPEDTE